MKLLQSIIIIAIIFSLIACDNTSNNKVTKDEGTLPIAIETKTSTTTEQSTIETETSINYTELIDKNLLEKIVGVWGSDEPFFELMLVDGNLVYKNKIDETKKQYDKLLYFDSKKKMFLFDNDTIGYNDKDDTITLYGIDVNGMDEENYNGLDFVYSLECYKDIVNNVVAKTNLKKFN
jgi:uncharacterized protein YprB with RNaseH-like and TPR domain